MQVIVPTSPIGVTMRPMPIPEYHVFIKVSFSNFSRLVPSCLKLFKLVMYVFGYVPFKDSKKNICSGTKKVLHNYVLIQQMSKVAYSQKIILCIFLSRLQTYLKKSNFLFMLKSWWTLCLRFVVWWYDENHNVFW